MATTSSGSKFREQVRAFESKNLDIFDVEEDAEYTFEMSRVHAEFQDIVESGIHDILRSEFSVSPKDFYVNLLKLRNKDNLCSIVAKFTRTRVELLIGSNFTCRAFVPPLKNPKVRLFPIIPRLIA